MSKENWSLVLVGIAVVLIAGLYAKETNLPIIGSTQQGSEYQMTKWNSSSSAGATEISTSTGISVTVGSVVITGANTGVLYLYDATTTNSGLRAASRTTSTISKISVPASTAAGTYTFDTFFTDGLIAEWVGTPATSTLTWR